MEVLIPMFVTSLLGVLLFINFVYFIKNTKEEKSTHNQTILGSVLTFFFIFSFMFFILSLH
jgi:cytoskeletal protein RodZ